MIYRTQVFRRRVASSTAPVVRSISKVLYPPNTGGASSTNIVIDKPAGTVNGDLLIFAFACSGTITTLAGWSFVRKEGYMSIYSKWANGEPANYSWVRTNSFAGGGMLAISGANATTPINISSGVNAALVAGVATATSVITTVANCLLIAIFEEESTNTEWSTPTGGWFEQWDKTPARVIFPAAYTKAHAAAGATGAVASTNTVTATGLASTGNASSHLLAIAPV